MGPVYEEVWKRLVQPEKDRDPEKKGFAVLITVERAEQHGRRAAQGLSGEQRLVPLNFFHGVQYFSLIECHSSARYWFLIRAWQPTSR
jgi:hypothetical protein